MTPLYTAEATVTGAGRAGGRGQTSDGRLKVEFSMPKELGGEGGDGTNPEQLVALGYAACFESALQVVARKRKLELQDPQVTVKVMMGRNDSGAFEFEFAVDAFLPNLSQAEAEEITADAHQLCPYSNAFRNGAPARANGRGGS